MDIRPQKNWNKAKPHCLNKVKPRQQLPNVSGCPVEPLIDKILLRSEAIELHLCTLTDIVIELATTVACTESRACSCVC
jgi:hypothetical protein